MEPENKNNQKLDRSEHVDPVHLMRDHEERDNERFSEIQDKLNKIMDMLTPMHDIYTGSIFTFKGITGVLKFLAMVGAAVGAVIYIMKLK